MSEHATTQFHRRRTPGTDREEVVVIGEIDVASSPRLAEMLDDAQASARCVVLDLGETTFIDAGAVHVLLAAEARARAGGGSFSVACPPSAVWRLLRLMGADRALGTASGAAAGPPLAAPPTSGRRPAASTRSRPLSRV